MHPSANLALTPHGGRPQRDLTSPVSSTGAGDPVRPPGRPRAWNSARPGGLGGPTRMMTRQLALKSSGATYGGVCERSGCHLVRLSAGCRRNRSVPEDARSPRPPPPRQHPTLSHCHSRPLPGEAEAAPQRHRVADAAQDSRRSVRLQQLNAGRKPHPKLARLARLTRSYSPYVENVYLFRTAIHLWPVGDL